MAYKTGAIPADAPAWLVRELRSISQAWEQSSRYLMLDTLYAAPERLIEGMVVKADGTAWDPGSGAGFYGYRGGAWHFLG